MGQPRGRQLNFVTVHPWWKRGKHSLRAISLPLSIRIRRWRFHLLTSATCRLAVDLRIIHHRNYQGGMVSIEEREGWVMGDTTTWLGRGRSKEESRRLGKPGTKGEGEPGQQRIPCSLVSLIIPFTSHAAWFWIEVHTAPGRFTSNPFPALCSSLALSRSLSPTNLLRYLARVPPRPASRSSPSCNGCISIHSLSTGLPSHRWKRNLVWIGNQSNCGHHRRTPPPNSSIYLSCRSTSTNSIFEKSSRCDGSIRHAPEIQIYPRCYPRGITGGEEGGEKKRKNRRKRDTVGYRLRFDGVKTSLKLNVIFFFFCETRPVTDIALGADFQFEKDRARLPSKWTQLSLL